jgi:hypothetical protein
MISTWQVVGQYSHFQPVTGNMFHGCSQLTNLFLHHAMRQESGVGAFAKVNKHVHKSLVGPLLWDLRFSWEWRCQSWSSGLLAVWCCRWLPVFWRNDGNSLQKLMASQPRRPWLTSCTVLLRSIFWTLSIVLMFFNHYVLRDGSSLIVGCTYCVGSSRMS